MNTFKNFVQCRVTSPITASADSIGLYKVESPYTLPPEEGGLLVLTDSPYKPSKLEVISYTSRSALNLYGVTRGLEGTTAQTWTGPVYCYQSLLAGEFKTLLDSKVDKNDGYIGDLSQLQTAAKSNLVAAINEAAMSGGGVSIDEVQVLTAKQQLTACTNIGVGNPTRNFVNDYTGAKL